MYLAGFSNSTFHLSVSSTHKKISNKDQDPDPNLTLVAFTQSLLCRLNSLTPPSLSLPWFTSSLHMLSSVHADARALISGLDFDADKFILPWYLDRSVKILDICNSFTSHIDSLRYRRLTFNYALHLLRNPSEHNILRARDLLSDWDWEWESKSKSCHSSGSPKRTADDVGALIRDLAAGLENAPSPPARISSAGKLVRGIVHAVSLLTLFVATALSSALRDSPDVIHVRPRLPSEFSWAASSFREVESAALAELEVPLTLEKKRWLLVEVAELEAGVKKAREAVDDGAIKEAVEELERRSGLLFDGLQGLSEAVNGMFRTVMEIRNDMIETLRTRMDSHLQLQGSKIKTKTNRVVPAVCSS